MAFDLGRFVAAQNPVYSQVLAELRAGRKTTHWMWFVFPQLQGLGRSPTAVHFGLQGGAEAAAYVAHPVLGGRLLECAGLMAAVRGRTAHEVFGAPDDMKLHSSMTLFDAVMPGLVFDTVLARFFAGRRDLRTLALLSEPGL